MEYRSARGFEKTLRHLHPRERIEVQRHVDALVRAMEAGHFPVGLGLQKLREALWEFRIHFGLRVLFQWHGKIVTFLFVGNHNEVRRFLGHYG